MIVRHDATGRSIAPPRPLQLLLLLLLLSWAAVIAAVTVAAPSPQSTSLVDLLNQSPEHSMLLTALQRARLVPTLNRLNGSVLWAPTNDAIKAEIEHEKQQQQQRRQRRRQRDDDDGEGGRATNDEGRRAIWSYAVKADDALVGQEHDNLQLALRDTLLYHMFNYTLFAPPEPPEDNKTTTTTTTTSVAAKASSTSTWTSSTSSTRGISALPLDEVVLHETLYYPSLSPYNKSFPAPPTLPGSPPDQPDPDRPHEVEGLLRGEGQRVRVVRKSVKGGKEELWIGGDWQGVDGAQAEGEIRYADNGALVALTAVLHKPVDLGTHIRTNPELSTLASLLPSSLLDYISTAPHLTLFAPTNDAWSDLSDLELKYLQSGFAEKDLTEIFGDETSREGAGDGKVGYLPALLGANLADAPAKVRTISNNTLDISTDKSGNALVNGAKIVTRDILAMNGVIHTVPSLLLPSGSLSLTAEKYLIALKATRFVSLLRSVNLSHYVQIPSEESSTVTRLQALSSFPSQAAFSAPLDDQPAYTILAPPDAVLQNRWWRERGEDEVDEFEGLAGKNLPAPGSPALKEILQYHIVSGKWLTDDLEDGMLVGTELRGKNLRGARQRLAVSVNVAEKGAGAGSSTGSSSWGISDPNSERKPGLVGFGGASIVGEPVVVGNTVIYLLSSILEPPASVITEAVSDLRLSTFVASVYAASLDKTLARQPAVTYLVPDNKAFTSLGLVMSYLLLPTARSELRSLVRYHAIDEIVYLDEFPNGGAARYPTLDSGAEIFVRRENDTVLVHGPTSGGIPTNGEVKDARVIEGDILTATGVIHVVDQVELPPTLNITIVKLMEGAKANTMLDLIRAANMSWVLEGKRPPLEVPSTTKKGKKDEPPQKKLPSHYAYTILCPTDKALSRLNLTYYLANPPLLEALVRLHVIPMDSFAPLKPDGHPLALADDASYPTLLDKREGGDSRYGSIAFRRWGDDGWLVGINGARGTGGESDSARVVSYGRASPSFVEIKGRGQRLAAGGGVLTIDSVLLPYRPGWFRRFGWIILVTVLGTVLVVLLGLLGWKLWRRSRKPVYEPLEGEED